MTDFSIPDDLADLLDSIAQSENRPVDEVVESVLRRYAITRRFPTKPSQPQNEAPESAHPFLVIAQAADQLGESSKLGNVVERSRGILAEDFPEYLMQRLRGTDADE